MGTENGICIGYTEVFEVNHVIWVHLIAVKTNMFWILSELAHVLNPTSETCCIDSSVGAQFSRDISYIIRSNIIYYKIKK